MKRLLIVVAFYFINIAYAWASPDIEIQALFTGKVVVLIDGKRQVLSDGETSPEGIKLITANTHRAVFEIDGKQEERIFGSSISLNFGEVKNIQEKVFANDRGMFMSVGSINGHTVRFLVDTGATTVAMNIDQAKRLGVKYKNKGVVTMASTASGFVKAYRVRLKTVTLGKIKRQNIEAMIIDGQHPGPILLGMSFLGDLKIEKSGNVLMLKLP